MAGQLQAGRIVINNAPHEPLAPFGGFKQSGIGREYGAFGLDAFLEPRAAELIAVVLKCRTGPAFIVNSELPEFVGRTSRCRRRELHGHQRCW